MSGASTCVSIPSAGRCVANFSGRCTPPPPPGGKWSVTRRTFKTATVISPGGRCPDTARRRRLRRDRRDVRRVARAGLRRPAARVGGQARRAADRRARACSSSGAAAGRPRRSGSRSGSPSPGVDISPRQVERARAEVAGRRVHLRRLHGDRAAGRLVRRGGVLLRLQPRAERAARAACSANIHRWLVPGGWLLTGLRPDRQSRLDRESGSAHRRSSRASRPEINSRLVREAGFAIEEDEVVAWEGADDTPGVLPVGARAGLTTCLVSPLTWNSTRRGWRSSRRRSQRRVDERLARHEAERGVDPARGLHPRQRVEADRRCSRARARDRSLPWRGACRDRCRAPAGRT